VSELAAVLSPQLRINEGRTIVQPPPRQIRAVFDDATITVYQAFSASIAIPAVSSGTLAETAFKFDRMTWIKPSFLWMMYRSGWASKPGQEHVLAIQMTRAGFDEALSQACLTHFDSGVYPDRLTWTERKRNSPVRVQWDPERNLAGESLPWRSIQIGLGGQAVEHYVSSWVVNITDVTPLVHQLHRDKRQAPHMLPRERPYLAPQLAAHRIGASAT
jgi:hypothetical protein